MTCTYANIRHIHNELMRYFVIEANYYSNRQKHMNAHRIVRMIFVNKKYRSTCPNRPSGKIRRERQSVKVTLYQFFDICNNTISSTWWLTYYNIPVHTAISHSMLICMHNNIIIMWGKVDCSSIHYICANLIFVNKYL